MERQVEEEAAVTPYLDEEDRELIKEQVAKAAEEAGKAAGSGKICIVCGKKATYCMRGLPNNTYCKECAKEHFKFLNYLERL